ncbi:MAG: U32 family peptidase [Kiritimatiellae bacterium]|nr:U32 family peptidase [Kiritimatiellia bacterium]
MNLPELLAPAGDRASFNAALKQGADAIYIGIGRFNMRRSQDGCLHFNQIPALVEAAHRQHAKLYVTLNTIVYQEELPELERTIACLKTAGVDAVIACDWAVIQRAKAAGIPVHISTQMSASNVDAVRFLASQGAERVVLARECSLEDIAVIAKEGGVPIEVFAHGAQCVATSGRCFLSQMAYGCSSSRGQCLQPCRRRYHIQEVSDGSERGADAAFEIGPSFILSAKDLCTLDLLPELVAAGVASLKIEGRARNPEYVANVIKAYRMALDAIAAGTYDEACRAACRKLVEAVYHRPFAEGLLRGRPGQEQFTTSDANLATEKKLYLGVIRNYYARHQVAEVLVHEGVLKPGTRVAIHGPKTGVVDFVVDALRQDDASPEAVARGAWATFVVPERVRPGDKVYFVVPAVPTPLR